VVFLNSRQGTQFSKYEKQLGLALEEGQDQLRPGAVLFPLKLRDGGGRGSGNGLHASCP
jgi:hypothetical protein